MEEISLAPNYQNSSVACGHNVVLQRNSPLETLSLNQPPKMSSSVLESIDKNLREDRYITFPLNYDSDSSGYRFTNSSGTYTIKGVTYLEGQCHEDKLVRGAECELFIEVYSNERLLQMPCAASLTGTLPRFT